MLDDSGNTLLEAFVVHFTGAAVPGLPSAAPPPAPTIDPPQGQPQPDGPLVLLGSGKPGNFVKAIWDGIDVFPRGVLVDRSGRWSMQLPSPPAGVTDFAAIQFDVLGQSSPTSEPVSVTVAVPKQEGLVLTAGPAMGFPSAP